MRRRRGVRRADGDRGNALVEFSWLAILLMVPLVYLVLTVFEVQRAAYAVTAASREAGRAYVTTTSGDPEARAVAAARLVGRDQGVELTAADVRVSCAQRPCLQPGGSVRVRVDTQVGLPFLPDVLFGQVPASVAVHARHVEVVDAYRDAPP
ncbi:MAG: hypothetical protein ACRDMV_00835 [Streptosporangiales bacterium]